jgi:hypothetical protein
MSPEQAMPGSEAIDARTDIYSLGASLYETLALKPPFEGEDPVQIITSIVSDEPAPPRRVRPDVPRDLETIALKAMAKDRRLRYPTARELADDLERFLREETIRARRPGPVLRARAWLTRRPSRLIKTAAVLVLVLAAAFYVRSRGGNLPPFPEIFEGMTLADFAPSAVSDLAAAGVAAEGTIHDWSEFLLPEEGMGTVVTVGTQKRESSLDLCAFGVRRELLWSARSGWPDYESTLGWGDSSIAGMKCLVTRGTKPFPEESLLLSGRHHGKPWLLVVDPRTGTRRSTWFRVPDLGRYEMGPCGTIPDWSDRPRRLIIPGRVPLDGGKWLPALFVLEADGTAVRQYRFPILGTGSVRDVGVRAVKCDWSPEQPEVVVQTSEDVFFFMPVRERRLDLSSVRVSLADNVDDDYDVAFGEGEFEKLVEESGGYVAFVRDLAGRVGEEGG